MIDELFKMDEKTIISIHEMAKIFQKSSLSVRRAVQRNELPPPVKLLGRDSWLVGNILKHFSNRLDTAKKQNLENFNRLATV